MIEPTTRDEIEKVTIKVLMETASDAYVFGASAVIDLEHIGMVMLNTVEPAPPGL